MLRRLPRGLHEYGLLLRAVRHPRLDPSLLFSPLTLHLQPLPAKLLIQRLVSLLAGARFGGGATTRRGSPSTPTHTPAAPIRATLTKDGPPLTTSAIRPLSQATGAS